MKELTLDRSRLCNKVLVSFNVHFKEKDLKEGGVMLFTPLKLERETWHENSPGLKETSSENKDR
jgi:hypothetical protein